LCGGGASAPPALPVVACFVAAGLQPRVHCRWPFVVAAGLQPRDGTHLASSRRVIHDRSPRLNAFDYQGFHRYHVRICTWNRRCAFDDVSVVCRARAQLFQISRTDHMAVTAYCFMRDHVHLLIRGGSPTASATRFVAAWKQTTGYQFSRTNRGRLWQPGFFDRVLRENEGDAIVSRYILEIPMRAELPDRFRGDPYVWCVWASEKLYE
jgi:putative transposase